MRLPVPEITTLANGWATMPVSEEMERLAKRIRADRDTKYGNRWPIDPGNDWRWVGDLGEIGFGLWLRGAGVEFQWFGDDAAGKPDFLVDGCLAMSIKTIKRTGPVRACETQHVGGAYIHEAVAYFFFTTYQYPERTLWLLGAITPPEMRRESRFYASGEWVHDQFQVPGSEGIWNVEYAKVIPAARWIDGSG